MNINNIADIFKNNKDLEFTKRVINSVSASIWYRDLEKNSLWVSSELAKLYGYTQKDFEDNPQLWKDCIYPEDMVLVEVHRKKLLSGMPSEAEYRIIRSDGVIRWVQESTNVIINKQGRVVLTLGIFLDVNDNKMATINSAESEERFRNLFDLSTNFVLIHQEGRMLFANPELLKILGASHENDILGKKIQEILMVEEVDLFEDRLERHLDGQKLSSFESKVKTLDGRVIDIESNAVLVSFNGKPAVMVVGKDVSEKKKVYNQINENEQRYKSLIEFMTEKGRMEKELKESEELNRRLVELSPEAIFFHYDYKCIYVNSAALEFLGASSLEDIVGRSIFEFIHPDFQQLSNFRLKEVYERQISTPLLEMKLIRKDQTVIDAEAVITPMQYMGKNAGFSLIRDVTKQKKAEEERNRAAQKIQESEERYSNLQASLDRFSQDLFGIMKVSELNRRFVKEVQNVIKAKCVSVIEVQEDNTLMTISCDSDMQELLGDFQATRNLPLNELFETLNGYLLKIGEISGKTYLLYIGEKPESLTFKPKEVWLKTISRYINVLYDNFRLIEDLTKELDKIASNQIAPAWLLRLLFQLSENERKNLSQDLHDSALQEQIIWYRRLDYLSTDPLISPHVREELQQVMQGLLDVIYQIRITCNELRPPMLKEEGLVSSLEALFEFTHLRANYTVQFDASQFNHTLTDDMLIGLYRIVQELLANATKHSNAAEVHVTLVSYHDQIELVYRDNGIGMDVKGLENSFNSMGVYGVKERVRSLDGKVEFHSVPNKGLTVCISMPAPSMENHTNLVQGGFNHD